MKQYKYTILAFIALVATTILLTIRNDIHFNEARDQDAKKMEERDSFLRKQMDSLSTTMKEVAVQVDSIRATQNELYDAGKLEQEAILQSLDQIKRTQRQLIKQTN